MAFNPPEHGIPQRGRDRGNKGNRGRGQGQGQGGRGAGDGSVCVPVHDVDVKIFGTVFEDPVGILGELGKVSREN